MTTLDFGTRIEQTQNLIQAAVIPLEGLLLNQQWDQLYPALHEIRNEVISKGLWAPHLPEELGGSNLTVMELGLLSEQLGQSPLAHYCFGCQAPDAGNAELLHLYATDELKSDYLLPLAKGEIRSCFAMTEPHTAGSNPTMLASRAEKTGSGWIINGRKWFTTAADGADFSIVMAVTDPNAPKHQRASMFVVPLDNPGYQMIRNIPVMGHSGQGYYSHSEVEFKDCEIPDKFLLGEPGQGFLMAQQRLGPGRIQHCMRWIGVARRCFDIMCQHITQRQITEQSTLADQPLMQAKVAQAYAALHASRALVMEAANLVDQSGYRAAKHHISMIKFDTAGMLQHVMDQAVQALGAKGVTDDEILAFYFREERAARIYDGPDEVHQLSLAKKLLKSYQ